MIRRLHLVRRLTVCACLLPQVERGETRVMTRAAEVERREREVSSSAAARERQEACLAEASQAAETRRQMVTEDTLRLSEEAQRLHREQTSLRAAQEALRQQKADLQLRIGHQLRMEEQVRSTPEGRLSLAQRDPERSHKRLTCPVCLSCRGR
jgi:septal ring factor EnvC (AmiA/AmiB activator)